MKIEQRKDAITRIDIDGYDSNWKKDILYLSDIHKDSIFCDDKLLKKHCDEAVKKDALILINGDLFDCMQGHNDPRRSNKELKPSYLGIDYFDRVLDDVIEFFRPYKDNLAMVGYGNHEYSVIYHNGTDLLQRFAGVMRSFGSQVVVGGYGGFIRISVYNKQTTPYASYRIYYNHGGGGDAPVTKGMIQTNRQSAYVRGADVVWNGHNHNEYVTHQSTLEINNKDQVVQGLVTFIRTPGYKNEYSEQSRGFNGFAASRMMAPTPRGCVWGELLYDNKRIVAKHTADVV